MRAVYKSNGLRRWTQASGGAGTRTRTSRPPWSAYRPELDRNDAEAVRRFALRSERVDLFGGTGGDLADREIKLYDREGPARAVRAACACRQDLLAALHQSEHLACFGWGGDAGAHPLNNPNCIIDEFSVRCQHTAPQVDIVFQTDANMPP